MLLQQCREIRSSAGKVPDGGIPVCADHGTRTRMESRVSDHFRQAVVGVTAVVIIALSKTLALRDGCSRGDETVLLNRIGRISGAIVEIGGQRFDSVAKVDHHLRRVALVGITDDRTQRIVLEGVCYGRSNRRAPSHAAGDTEAVSFHPTDNTANAAGVSAGKGTGVIAVLQRGSAGKVIRQETAGAILSGHIASCIAVGDSEGTCFRFCGSSHMGSHKATDLVTGTDN